MSCVALYKDSLSTPRHVARHGLHMNKGENCQMHALQIEQFFFSFLVIFVTGYLRCAT